jgi:thiol-disulfide isomerase/thioredoxin
MKSARRSLAVALVLCGAAICATAQPTLQQTTVQQPTATPTAPQQPASPQTPVTPSPDQGFDQELAAGKQAFSAGNYRDAATHLDKALGAATTDPQRMTALLYLGVVFAAGNRLSDAETAFRMALARDPGCSECGFNLGYVLLKESKDAEGVAALKAVLPQLTGTPREREVQRFIADPRRARLDFAPEFSVKTAAGDTINLDTLRGKVVLLDFWGAWCTPCRQTIPLLKQMAEQFDPAKVAFVSVDEHDPKETWTEFIAKNGMTWPQAYDEDGSLKSAFRVDGFPSSVLLSKDGIILRKFKGWGPGWERVMRAEIEKALAQN